MMPRRRRKRPSSMKAFLHGVSPTGVGTFRLGLKSHKRHAARLQTLGITGGLIGGATVVPAILTGASGAIKGFATRGIKGILPGAAAGAISPYKAMYDLARAQRPLSVVRAGRKLTGTQTRRLKKVLDYIPVGEAIKSKGIVRTTSAAARELQKHTRAGLAQTGFAISASGALGGLSAYKQFSLGQRVQTAKRRR